MSQAELKQEQPGRVAQAKVNVIGFQKDKNRLTSEAGSRGEDTATLRFSDIHLPTGVRLRYAEQGDPQGHTVVMLHGYSDSWFSFSRVLPSMDEAFHVFVLDQRGHGDSGRPPGEYAVSDFAADVTAFMEAMEISNATLVGHSMGSFIARSAALAAPQAVARLVLVGSATTVRNEVVSEVMRAVEALNDPVPVEFVREFQESTVYQSLPDEFMERVVAESLKLPARVWRAVLRGLLEADDLSSIVRTPQPALVVWGDRDAIFSEAEQQSLISLLPNAVLKVYAETGHAPHWEQPYDFVKDLKDFISTGA